MANYKSVYLPYDKTGQSGTYARVFQISTSYWLDNVDGVFRALPATPNIPLAEQSGAPMVYWFTDNRTVWSNGQYLVYGYDSINFLFAGLDYYVLSDNEVSLAVLLDYMWLIKKIEEGDWELVDDKWIYYDVDHITPLIQFNTYDSNGNPTMQNIFKRTRI